MRILKMDLVVWALDLLLALEMVLGVYVGNYLIPQKAQAAVREESFTEAPEGAAFKTQSLQLSAGQEKGSSGDWHEKFADHFSDEVVSEENLYTSPDLSITVTHHTYDTGVRDNTAEGKHKKYGTKISYTLADIYMGDISCFQTAFAQDTYGIGYTESLDSMALRMGSVLAVNGDSYSNNRHRENGTIIRNGVVYRAEATDAETCVLFRDGTMKIYRPEELDPEQLISDGAWQSWVFGPGLLDGNGKAKTDFLTWDYIRESHPRTAIGYYEPGHYCLLVVDGRQKDFSRGMFLEEMAALFEELGCQAAYNLDGGHCSFMDMKGHTVTRPYHPDHEISDGIFITEGSI